MTRNLKKVSSWIVVLIIALDDILDASNQVTREDLQEWYAEDGNVRKRLKNNPLRDFLELVAMAHETESESAMKFRRGKLREKRKVRLSATASTSTNVTDESPRNFSTLHEETSMEDIQPPNSELELKSLPPEHKRNVSELTDSSFVSSSTDTMPQKLEQAEAYVQEIQNMFVHTMLKLLWEGDVPISWARGRKMWLAYLP